MTASVFYKVAFKAVIVWALLVGISSCAPIKPYKLAEYKRDPQFNLIEMLATGLVLGGVTVTAYPVNVDERNALTDQLEDVITKFSLYRINTPEKLSKRISGEEYESLLEYFKENKTIPIAEIKKLKGLMTPARYLLFVNIDSNEVIQKQLYHSNSIEYRSMRTIVATVNIVNLETSKSALFTRIAMQDVKSNNVQQLGVGGSVGILLGNVIAQVSFGGYPELPTTTHALYRVFLGVADLIPSS